MKRVKAGFESKAEKKGKPDIAAVILYAFDERKIQKDVTRFYLTEVSSTLETRT